MIPLFMAFLTRLCDQSPFPGAATGAGGEIRDEGAVGRGSCFKAGLTGFSVSNLLPDLFRPWDLEEVSKPGHIASGLEIMLEGKIFFRGCFSYD